MLQNREGQRVPDVTFRTRQGADWVNRTSKEIFDGRTVIAPRTELYVTIGGQATELSRPLEEGPDRQRRHRRAHATACAGRSSASRRQSACRLPTPPR